MSGKPYILILTDFLPGLRLAGIILIYLVLSQSCTGLRGLTDEQILYTGSSIQFKDEKHIDDPKILRKELEELIKPKPNKKILGMRISLWIHNNVREPKKDKGLRNWLKYKVGKTPVLFNEGIVEKNVLILDNRLHYKGFFSVKSDYEVEEKDKKISVKYVISTGIPYRIDSVSFPESDTPIERDIANTKSESLIKTGLPYDLETLKKERKRIELELKDNGYYYFYPDYLIYRIDTTPGEHKMRVFLNVKPQTPQKSLTAYSIRNVKVIDDFKANDSRYDSVVIDRYNYFSDSHYIRPEIVTNMLTLKPGMLYNRDKHNSTISRLESMGSFGFVTIKYDNVSDSSHLLDASILLSPANKMSLNTEMNIVSKTNNFAGPGLKLTFRNRNFFKGAETFTANLSGRFETQISGDNKGNTAYEISTDVNLTIPRIIPFGFIQVKKKYVPYTKFTLGFGIYQRLELYRFNSSLAAWKFNWKRNEQINHEFKLIDISYTNIANATDEFNEWLEQNPSIKKSFEEQFILGSTYAFTFNNLDKKHKKQYFFRFTIDPSGNLATGIMMIGKKEKPTPENPYKLFGNPISQFIRLLSDNRYYFKTGKESLIATRLFIGAGLPYGNSSTIPYVRQFFVGGTNSLRGFHARSVGPGTYSPPDSLAGFNIDQTGDIKAELNIEYRFPISRYLKGGLFVDIGNVWLVNEDTLRPGAAFDINSFYKELAMSGGFGLRIDLDVVVIRFDLGFPIRKPWLPDDERWVIGDFNLFNRDWRRKNLILNFSVGYPF